MVLLQEIQLLRRKQRYLSIFLQENQPSVFVPRRWDNCQSFCRKISHQSSFLGDGITVSLSVGKSAVSLHSYMGYLSDFLQENQPSVFVPRRWDNCQSFCRKISRQSSFLYGISVSLSVGKSAVSLRSQEIGYLSVFLQANLPVVGKLTLEEYLSVILQKFQLLPGLPEICVSLSVKKSAHDEGTSISLATGY